MRSRNALGDGVLLEAQDRTYLAMRETIPRDEAQELPIGLAKGIEGAMYGLLFFPADDRYIRRLRMFRWETTQTSRQPSAAGPSPVLVTDYPVRRRQQPGLGHFGVRYLVEAPPGDGKNFGRAVLGIVGIETAEAVAKDIGVVPLEKSIEAQLGVGIDGYVCPR